MDSGSEPEHPPTKSTCPDSGNRAGVSPLAPIRREIRFTVVPSRVFRILLFVIAVLVALSTASQMLALYLQDFPLLDSIANLLYVDSEGNLPTLYSTGAILVVALLCRCDRTRSPS